MKFELCPTESSYSAISSAVVLDVSFGYLTANASSPHIIHHPISSGKGEEIPPCPKERHGFRVYYYSRRQLSLPEATCVDPTLNRAVLLRRHEFQLGVHRSVDWLRARAIRHEIRALCAFDDGGPHVG